MDMTMLKLPEIFDDAVIGTSQRIGLDDCIVYSADKVIEILSEDMSQEDALEHFDFNIAGAFVGETTPIFVWSKTMQEIEETETH